MRCKINPIAVAAALLIAIAPTTTHAQQVKHWRVIAMSNSTDQTISPTTDSTIFIYSSGSLRGSTYNNDRISYDSAARYFFDGRLGLVLYNIYNKEYASAGDDMVARVVRSKPDYSRPEFTTDTIDSVIYDASGRVVREVHYQRTQYGNYADPFSRNTYRFDANGNMIEKFTEYAEPRVISSSSAPVYKPGNYNFYTYDANGKLLRDSMSKFHGNNGGWKFHGEVNYTYDANGYLSREHGIDSNSNDWFVKRYQHDSNGVLLRDSLVKFFNSTYSALEMHSYVYGSNGLLIRDSIFSSKVSIKDYAYTPFDYVDNVLEYRYNRQTNTYDTLPNEMIQYYYEPYYFPVSTASVSTASELVAYPVPSSNFINIKWEVAKPTKLDARIVNTQGQTVRQWHDNADRVYYKSINTGSLPSGNYYIIIKADDIQMKKAIVITK